MATLIRNPKEAAQLEWWPYDEEKTAVRSHTT